MRLKSYKMLYDIYTQLSKTICPKRKIKIKNLSTAYKRHCIKNKAQDSFLSFFILQFGYRNKDIIAKTIKEEEMFQGKLFDIINKHTEELRIALKIKGYYLQKFN